MQSSQENTLTAPAKGSSGLGAGLFLLITAVATLVAVVTRVSANADQPTLAESLVAISENKALYASGGGARFVSGVTLVVAAWFLSKTGTGENQPSVRIVSLIFALSGLFTAVSGGSAIALANAAPAPPDTLPETTAYVRWLTGKIGFTLAGLALIPEARRQWNLGTPFKYLALASGVIGIFMQFIWWDAATAVHRITGIGFLFWLVIVGVLLLRGHPRPAHKTS